MLNGSIHHIYSLAIGYKVDDTTGDPVVPLAGNDFDPIGHAFDAALDLNRAGMSGFGAQKIKNLWSIPDEDWSNLADAVTGLTDPDPDRRRTKQREFINLFGKLLNVCAHKESVIKFDLTTYQEFHDAINELLQLADQQ